MKLRKAALVSSVGTVALLTPVGMAGAASPAAFEAASARPHAAASAARADTSIRFLTFDSVRRYGYTTTIRGQVAATVNGTQGAVAGVHVKLSRKLNGTSTWVYLKTRRTTQSAYPHFRFRVTSIGNARYRVRFGGNSTLQPSRNRTYVRVFRPISGRIEDRTGRFHGRVTPHYRHRTVYLAKRSCAGCPWNRVRSERTGAHGRYSFRVGAPRHGRWFWRVSTPASTRFIRSYSGVFTTRLG
jgi:hypothetical protein